MALEEEKKEEKIIPQTVKKDASTKSIEPSQLKKNDPPVNDPEKKNTPEDIVSAKEKPINSPSEKGFSFKRKKPFTGKRSSYFSKNSNASIDYKRVDVLVYFISNKGKILPRRVTGLSALQQRRVSKVIKRARMAGILPFCVK